MGRKSWLQKSREAMDNIVREFFCTKCNRPTANTARVCVRCLKQHDKDGKDARAGGK